jgi:hypothetical protein
MAMGMGLLLSGMLLSVVSAALKWAPAPRPPASDLAGALYRAPTAHASAVTGFSLSLGFVSLGWLLTLCGLISAALLLIPPSATATKERRLFLTVQVSLGLVPLSLAVYHWSLYAGVFCAATAGILQITAGVLLYGPQNRDNNDGIGGPNPADAGQPPNGVV